MVVRSFYREGCFLFLFGNMISAELGSNFSQKQKIFLIGDMLLPIIHHGFLRSAENVYIHDFLVVLGKMLFPSILFDRIIGRCYCLMWQVMLLL